MKDNIDILTSKEVNDLAAKIKDNWSLCQFMEGHGSRASEKEYMIAETIHAAKLNLEAHGEPFSFRGDGVFSVQGGGLADNATAYGYLVREGYFREDTREGRPVIFPTRRLAHALFTFFAKPEQE